MATYKVIQDIEAEDKFLGPLTLKQFIFGAGGLVFGYLCVFALTRGLSFLLVIFVPPMLLGIFLAVPWSKDQPTEVWVLAKLRFMVKPRVRIWDQSGMEELVTITAPKKVEKQLTDNLSQNEVKSRLQALASTIDSRGWAVKQSELDLTFRPENSDRLVSASTLPQEVPIIDIASLPDPYAITAETSENFDRMIQQSTELRKAQNLEKMERIRSGEPLENIVLPEVHFTPPPTDVRSYLEPVIDEKSLNEELKYRKAPDSLATAHMRTIQPLNSDGSTAVQTSGQPNDNGTKTNQTSANPVALTDDVPLPEPVDKPMPSHSSPGILEYAGNNDLNIATIARQAKKDQDAESNEVVVSLR